MFQEYVFPTLAVRKTKFINAVESATGNYKRSDALLGFAATALRRIELGASEFETELWTKATIAAATNPPAAWQAILAVLDSGHLEPNHIVLLRILSDPAGTHERFGIPIPANDPLVGVLRRAMSAATGDNVSAEDVLRYWHRLAELGLASIPSQIPRENIKALGDFSTTLGHDFRRLICGTEPLCPLPKAEPVEPERIPTGLRWLANEQPRKYVFAESGS